MDIQVSWNPATGQGDWYLPTGVAEAIVDQTGAPITDDSAAQVTDGLLLVDGTLVASDLGTAVLVSLFTDRTADTDDVIPDGSNDPRGWWGNLGQDVPIGSKLWLRGRSKQTALTLALVKADIETALQWLIDDEVAGAVDVTTEWSRPGFLGAMVVVTKGDGTKVGLGFEWAWKEIA